MRRVDALAFVVVVIIVIIVVLMVLASTGLRPWGGVGNSV
jgi:hypothetical protein